MTGLSRTSFFKDALTNHVAVLTTTLENVRFLNMLPLGLRILELTLPISSSSTPQPKLLAVRCATPALDACAAGTRPPEA